MASDLNSSDQINILVFNITNEALNEVFKKYEKTFKLEERKLTNLLKNLKQYQVGSSFYSHTDILSKDLHNPFVLDKASNDFSYWLTEISSTIMTLIEHISTYAGGDVKLSEFVDNLQDYIDGMPDVNKLRQYFLDQVPLNVKYDEVFAYRKKDWIESIDLSVTTCEGALTNLNKIITMIELLTGHINKLKIYKDNLYSTKTGKDYSNVPSMDKFLKFEIKIHSILEVSIKKMVEYSIIRFSDLVEVSEYIISDIKSIKGELWK